MIGYFSLQGFYVRSLELDDHPDPVLVVKDKTVLDLNQAALKRRVSTEMDFKHAKACLMGGRVIEWKSDEFELSQKEWLDRCLSYSDIIEPDEQHSAWVDLSLHPDPFRAFLNLRDELAPIKCSLSKIKWLAKLAALYGDPDYLAYRDPATYLSKIPVTSLDLLSEQVKTRLEFLGYPYIGQARRIPLEILIRQFGSLAIEIYNVLQGKQTEEVLSSYPLLSSGSRHYFSDPVEDSRSMEHALLQISERIGKKLDSRDLFGNDIELRVECEDAPTILRKRSFTKPIYDRRTIYFASKLLCGTIEIIRPVTAIRITVNKLKKRNRFQQSFETYQSTKKDKSAADAVLHIKNSFGVDAIRTAGEIKVPRRTLVLKEWRNATGWI